MEEEDFTSDAGRMYFSSSHPCEGQGQYALYELLDADQMRDKGVSDDPDVFAIIPLLISPQPLNPLNLVAKWAAIN